MKNKMNIVHAAKIEIVSTEEVAEIEMKIAAVEEIIETETIVENVVAQIVEMATLRQQKLVILSRPLKLLPQLLVIWMKIPSGTFFDPVNYQPH